MPGLVSDIFRVFFEKEDYFCTAKDLDNSEHGGIAVALGLRVMFYSRILIKLIFVVLFVLLQFQTLINTFFKYFNIRPQKLMLRIKLFTSQMASPLHIKNV